MKILHINEYYMDGWTYQENILPQKQAELGNNVILIASTKYPNYYEKQTYTGEKEYFYKDVKIIREEYKKCGLNLHISNLNKHLHEESPDHIFLHGMAIIKNKALMHYIIEKRPKVTVDVHEDFNNHHINKYPDKIIDVISKLRYRLLISKYMTHIDKIFYVAPSCKKFCMDFYGIPEDKLFPLFLGSDYDMISFDNRPNLREKLINELGLNANTTLLVFAGKIDRNKKIELLIEAFNNITVSNLHLVLVGSVSDEYKEYISQSLLNNANISFLGWKNNKDLMDLLLTCDLGVFPGGQSVIWQQSLCCGLPCIYGWHEGISYLNNGNAVILENRTVEELSSIIKNLTVNKTKLEEMREIAQNYGYKEFNYLNIAQKSLQ